MHACSQRLSLKRLLESPRWQAEPWASDGYARSVIAARLNKSDPVWVPMTSNGNMKLYLGGDESGPQETLTSFEKETWIASTMTIVSNPDCYGSVNL